MQLHSVTKSLSRALVLAGVLLFGVSVMAQSTFVITNGEAQKRKFAEVGQVFLAINEDYTGVVAVPAFNFNERCVWHRTGKTGYYYQNDAVGNTYFLRRNGENLQLDKVPAGQLLSSTTSWYDWSFGVATQELGGDPQYHWIVTNADNSGWKMSGNTYGRPGWDETKGDNGETNDGRHNSAITNDQVSNSETRAYGLNRAATFNPVVTTVVVPQNNYTASGNNGLDGATITTTNYGYMIAVSGDNNHVTATVSGITSYTSQTTPGYTKYELQDVTNPMWTCTSNKYDNSCYDYGYAGGDYEQYTHTTVQTWYCYGGAAYNAAPAGETSPTTKSVSSYVWTLSGPAAHFLSLESTGNVISKTVTDPSSIVVYYTTTSSRNLSATLTLTAYYSDGTTQTLTTDVHITNPVTPTGLNVASTTDITRGETATIPVAVLPHNAVQDFTFSGDHFSKDGTNLIFDGTTVATGSYTATLHPAFAGGIADEEVSQVVTVNVHPEAPTAVTFGDGTITDFARADNSYNIYYTTDASVNLTTAGGTQWDGSAITINPGQTVYAVAEQGGLRSLSVFSARYAGPATGVSGSAVVLNDLEDHSWSYYSDPDCPIRSLNPADVKITYYGNGTDNMTSTSTADAPANSAFDADATGVKVNIGDDENTFVYYKTLERTNGSTATSASAANGNLKYTTIPNPFQVRPVYDGGSSAPTTVTLYVTYTRAQNGSISMTYYDATGTQRTFSGNSGSTVVARVGTTVSVSAQGRSGGMSNRTYSRIYVRYENATGELLTSAVCDWNNYYDGVSNTATVSAGSTDAKYRGFYAWRIKSLSNGLSVNGRTGVGDTITADQEIEFVTTKEYGNEIELEALWAQAYVEGGYHSGVTYERNFVVGSGNVNYPATYSSIYPNGTTDGTNAASSIPNTAYDITRSLGYDSKFENMNVSESDLDANAHNLIVGRGVSGTINTVYGALSGKTGNADYCVRLENGTFGNITFTAGFVGAGSGYSFSGANNKFKGVIGCDYDRAKEQASTNYDYTSAPLKVNGVMIYGYNPSMPYQTVAEAFNCVVKSGYLGVNNQISNASAANSFYLGIGGNYRVGKRRLTIEGGNLKMSLAGGIDATANSAADDALVIRMKGGRVQGAVYGAAEHSEAHGGRLFIFTGGTVNGWIAGGANGTQTSEGRLDGSTRIYFGGKAKCNSNGSATSIGSGQARGGNIFGAGSGNSTANPETGTVGQVNGSTVVIADECEVERNVYGGGNYGFVSSGYASNIYVLGGTVDGAVFGGSNMQRGQTVNITMKGGKVLAGVFGGSNTQGTINNDVTINVTGGQVGTSESVTANVHGGGFGNQTRVTGNVDITIGAENATDGPTIYGDVYGGSAMGTVNGTDYGSTKHTKVTVHAGTIKANNGTTNTTRIAGDGTTNGQTFTSTGSVYGGGLGTTQYAANVYAGTTKVTVTGGTMNNTFGANNVNGMPYGTIATEISGGTIGNVYGGGNAAPYGAQNNNAVPTVLMTGGHVLQNVFGGGLGSAAQITTNRGTDVKVQAGTVDGNVYGGGAKADVTGNTNVEIGK